MGEASPDTLRQLAPKWTLAGDDTLLSLLQNTHQKIVSKCQEVNTKLEAMVSSLDDASIHLQNVNNKFMSLSNRQFIESRVYDDDADLTTDVQTNKESPPSQLPDELSMLKNSLAILDSAHEITEIMDDSDSDSDNEISIVLKPKDMYSSRPLPYIIGSQQWKSKWHAGLITENSDSESLQSKENTDMEYSDTDTDEQMDRQMDNTISESSSLHSDRLQSDRVQESNPHTAAQIAANIASVMAQTQPIIERPITPPTPKEYLPTNKKPPTIYKPTQPVTSTVFPDEPPPLEQYDSDSSEHDIFAEINKINKNKIVNTNNNNVADDLFGDNRPYGEGDRVDNEAFDSYEEPVKEKPAVIQRELDTESFDKERDDENITKKPIGGISLFGSNKNTDTIGAAILKRNLRHTSNSDESESEEVKIGTFKPKAEVKQNIEVKKDITKQKTEMNQNIDELDNKATPKKDIFEDLFAKKDKKIQKEEKTVKNEVKKKEVNLFSDNIFDDVDDIFSSNVKVTSKAAKSLFDSDDDLFSDIAKPKSMKPETSSSKEKSKTVDKLFESDDELFSDLKSTQNKKVSEEKSTKIDATTTKEVVEKESTNIKNVNPRESTLSKKDGIIENPTKINETKTTKPQNIVKTKSIFDSDSDDDILNFSKTTTKKSHFENNSAKKSKGDDKKFQNPSLFDDDDDNEVGDIFNSKNNKKVPNNKNEFDNDSKQDKLDSITKTVQSKSQDQNTVTAQSKVIHKETLKSSEEDTQLKNQSVTVQEVNILVKEKAALNLNRDSSKSNDNPQNVTTKSERIKPSDEAKKILRPDTCDTIFNEALVKDKQSLNEHLAKENENLLKENLFKENDNLTKETIKKDLPKEDLYKNISNEDENVPEVPIFNENEQKTDDIFQNTKENLFKENKSQVTKGTLNENISQINKNLHTLNDNLPPNSKDLNTSDDNGPQVDEDLSTPNENIPQSSKIPENENITQVSLIPEGPPPFDAILTEPPIFEKPKEPKKSKNVNALFDDDSEDEALFFKKNDVISDVKPEVFSQTANFGLFADEPPAIEDFENDLFSNNDRKDSMLSKNDSIQSKSDEFDDGLLNKSEVNDSLFTKGDQIKNTDSKIDHNYENPSKSDNLDNTSQDSKLTSESITKPNLLKDNLFENSSDEEIFTEKLPKLPEKSNLNNNKTKSIFDDLDDNLFTNKKALETNIFSQESAKKSTDEIKKIGKINTQNININVQALMPGASPKKVKVESQNTEPKTVEIEPKISEISEPNIEEINEQKISEKSKPTMVKSLSFEDSPDTDVLDNNASKKRAKIQVKRRPSSRRARHEAVRKSTVDTDKGNLDIDKESLDRESKNYMKERSENSKFKDYFDTNEELSAKDKGSLDIDKEILHTEKTSLDTKTTNYKDRNIPVTKLENTEPVENENKIQENNTKIVYVLNDEDIFQTNKDDLVEPLEIETNKIPLFDDQSDSTKNLPSTSLFPDDESDITVKPSTKTKKSTKISVSDDQSESTKKVPTKTLFDNDETDTAETSAKTATAKKEMTKVSLFDDQNQGETSTKTKNSATNEKTKISLFDSDEEDEKSLFKTKPIVTKTKLFDSDSDEDLFSSAKTKTKNVKKDTVMKKSLFDDENEEMFGAKNDKIDKKKTTKTAKESSKKTIFADPLSLFGDDDDD